MWIRFEGGGFENTNLIYLAARAKDTKRKLILQVIASTETILDICQVTTRRNLISQAYSFATIHQFVNNIERERESQLPNRLEDPTQPSRGLRVIRR